MSGVVIRCQNCGTTQNALGECEACHEAEAAYYCPNHSPGRWLPAPACDACGAAVGVDPIRKPVPAPRVERVRTPAPPRAREIPPAPREPRRPAPEDLEDLVSDILGGRAPVRPPVDEWVVVDEPPARGGRSAGPLLPAGAIKIISAFGCLRRLVMIVVILIVLAVLAFFSLFGVGGMLYGSATAPPLQVTHGPCTHPAAVVV